MLVRTAIALASLAFATPASAVTGGYGVSKALHGGHGAVVAAAAIGRDDKSRSCQASDRSARSSGDGSPLLGDAHRPAVVACEQPPKSNLIPPDALAKATASALAAFG
jgi:hypothetical protein